MTPIQRAGIMALNIHSGYALTPPIGDTGIWVNIPDYSSILCNNQLIWIQKSDCWSTR